MATLQIDLPESQISWIEDQVRNENVAAREVILDELVEDAQKNDVGY